MQDATIRKFAPTRLVFSVYVCAFWATVAVAGRTGRCPAYFLPNSFAEEAVLSLNALAATKNGPDSARLTGKGGDWEANARIIITIVSSSTQVYLRRGALDEK